MNRLHRFLLPLVLLVVLVAVAGCGKKTKTSTSSAAMAPAATALAPTAQLSATPAFVSAGDQVQLSWHTTEATTVSIDGIGDVPRPKSS